MFSKDSFLPSPLLIYESGKEEGRKDTKVNLIKVYIYRVKFFNFLK